MENIESIDRSETNTLKVTQARWERAFSARREEASELAAQHRARLQRLADASGPLTSPPAETQASEPVRQPIEAPQTPQDTGTPEPKAPRKAPQGQAREDFELIALWSVVAPSTITAVFAGVAMASSQVPLAYALAFVCAWFALTSGLAVGALKLFNTEQLMGLLRSSTARRGIAAVSCALVAVLTVEAARLSITSIAAPKAQQVGENTLSSLPLVQSAHAQTQPAAPAAEAKKTVSAGSVHYLSTPAIIFPASSARQAAAPKDTTVVSLPAPAPQAEMAEEGATQAVNKAAPRSSSDKLLGRISAKGKFLAHRSSSRWTGSPKRAAKPRRKKTRRVAAPDTRTILEKIFNPVIDSAGAKAPARRVGADSDDQAQFSR